MSVRDETARSAPDSGRPAAPSRRERWERERESRRPSRAGRQPGTSPVEYRLDGGFPVLLADALARARAARTLTEAVRELLTLAGTVEERVGRRGLTDAELLAVELLTERAEEPTDPVLTGAVGLSTSGRLLVSLPDQRVPSRPEARAGVARWVGWTAADVARYRELAGAVRERDREDLAACRAWLRELDQRDLAAVVADLRRGALRTAPFTLYRGEAVFTNFRERNNLTGKTLAPGHPQCLLTGLEDLDVDLWSDDEAELVVCLHLLVASGGYHRIEECNVAQVRLRRIAEFLGDKAAGYRDAGVLPAVPGEPDGAAAPADGAERVRSLAVLAEQLRSARARLIGNDTVVYRRIQGPLMVKDECLAAPLPSPDALEAELCTLLGVALPTGADSLAGIAEAVRRDPAWLAEPVGGFGTGLEHLVHAVVTAAIGAFGADFAMSRGLRSMPRLVAALRAEAWEEITAWELPDYYCCVLTSPEAPSRFGSRERCADAAWAMAARMQYNSWHFLPGNLPRVAAVEARDHYVPPVVPDISLLSDQHHRGHVAARVRYCVRSPQQVRVLGRPLAGFVDLRLLRCEGPAFTEPDLVVAHRLSAVVAAGVEAVAALVEQGASVEVEAFDHGWHRRVHLGTTGAAGQD
ncbi:MAG: hypothetical protein GXX79_18130 [Actinomycetales bacterium]|nr:hypothetical protein [Actinomycetales bacterium]